MLEGFNQAFLIFAKGGVGEGSDDVDAGGGLSGGSCGVLVEAESRVEGDSE